MLQQVKKLSQEEVRRAKSLIDETLGEVRKVFFGRKEVTEALIRALLCDGHVLIEGVPGIAKTLVIKTLAKVSGCSAKRIQFTVDMLPTDIVGLTTYHPDEGFQIVKGPIFANFIIADEINRAPPKTQSALIEAMQEGQVTIGKKTFELPSPFFVMANQNPIETEGVYILPEAQIDRFLFKIIIDYPDAEAEERIMEENVTLNKFRDLKIRSTISPAKLLELQQITKKVFLDDKIKKYIIGIVSRTRDKDSKYGEYLELGCSPRASIALFIAAKAEALMNGRNFVIPRDVKVVALESLRHRIILNYRAQADKITTDKVINEILGTIKAP